MTGTVFTVRGTIHQNAYLPPDGREMHAVLSLTTAGPDRDAPDAAEVLVLDASGSMDRDGKRDGTIEAATAAITQIRDGVEFAVVAGSHEAVVLWPGDAGLRVADARTKADAVRALQGLPARGGTTIGRWLGLSRDLLAGSRAALRHVTLLTDGRNEHESADDLDDVVRSCVGLLRCDCRGIGVDFDPAELYNIAEKLDGTLRAVVDPERLAEDFAALLASSMDKQVELELSLWTPAGATVRTLRQATPSIAELVPIGSDTANGVVRYLLGGFGNETRDYLLCVAMDPPSRPATPARTDAVGEPRVLARKLLGRVSVAVRNPRPGGPELVQDYAGTGSGETATSTRRGQIHAVWTDDPVASLGIDERVAAARGSLDLARDLREGVLAWRDGRTMDADTILRDVRARAASLGDMELERRMNRIYDEAGDMFRLDARDEVELFEESTMTTRLDP